METLQKVAASIRSLRASYLKGPLERHAPVVYLVCRHPPTAAVVASQIDTIGALAKSSKSPPPAAVHMVADGCAAPRGCATEVLDQHTEVHILLRGVVDLSKEVRFSTRSPRDLRAISVWSPCDSAASTTHPCKTFAHPRWPSLTFDGLLSPSLTSHHLDVCCRSV